MLNETKPSKLENALAVATGLGVAGLTSLCAHDHSMTPYVASAVSVGAISVASPFYGGATAATANLSCLLISMHEHGKNPFVVGISVGSFIGWIAGSIANNYIKKKSRFLKNSIKTTILGSALMFGHYQINNKDNPVQNITPYKTEQINYEKTKKEINVEAGN